MRACPVEHRARVTLIVRLGLAVLSLSLAVGVGRPSASQHEASPADPGRRLEGNWFVEWYEAPAKGHTVRRMLSLYRAPRRLCNGAPFDPSVDRIPRAGCTWTVSRADDVPWQLTGDQLYTAKSVTPEAGGLRIQHPYGILGTWGGSSIVRPAGDDALAGEWSYQGRATGHE